METIAHRPVSPRVLSKEGTAVSPRHPARRWVSRALATWLGTALAISILFAPALLAGPAGPIVSALAAGADTESAAGTVDLQAAYDRVIALQRSGSHAEAVEAGRTLLELAERQVGPDQPDTAAAMLALADSLVAMQNYAEAGSLYDRAMAIAEARLGPSHALTIGVWNGSANLYSRTGDYAAAIRLYRKVLPGIAGLPGVDSLGQASVMESLAHALSQTDGNAEAGSLYERALALREDAWGKDSALLGPAVSSLASFYQADGQLERAASLMRRLVAIHGREYGQDDARTSVTMNNLALVLQELRQYEEAEDLFRRALAIEEKALDPLDPDLALSHANLADLLSETGHYADAETHYRNALSIREAALGPEDADTAVSLNDLSLLMWTTGRLDIAEALQRRALAIREKVFGPDDAATAQSLGNLGIVLFEKGAYAEAEAIQRRALAVDRTKLGRTHPDTSKAMNNLALALQAQGRHEEAADLFREALEIDEVTSGPDHLNTAIALDNLANALAQRRDASSLEQAYGLKGRALAIRETVLGPTHPDTAQSLDGVATLLASLGRWSQAQPLFDHAVRAAAAPENRAALRANDHIFVAAAANRLALSGQAAAEKAFLDAQWPIVGQASTALGATASRLAAGEPDLAKLVRQRQDVDAQHRQRMADILSAYAAGDAERAARLRADSNALAAQITDLDETLAERFPRFASLNGADPLDAATVTSLLQPGEVLLLLAPGHYRASGDAVAGSIYALRWDGKLVAALLEEGDGLQRDATTLRCMIDATSSDCTVAAEPVVSTASDSVDSTRGATSMVRGARPGGFDLALAHDVYRRMIDPIAGALEGVRSLLVVTADDDLANLPLQVLVGRRPDPSLAGADALRAAHWLARDLAISSLPSVSSLRALRRLASEAAPATHAFLGIGDPVIGTGAAMECGDQQPDEIQVAALPDGPLVRAGPGGDVTITDVEAVRALPRLADTRCELQRIADTLGSGDLLLDEEASETQVKALDASGALASYRILAFATHGLTAGSVGGGEPALVLTPPRQASSTDDGLFTASEIAALNLNADWVILSACNTAAGEKDGAESLSGLARAFFYAGSRSLLVSHWPVVSSAAVRITTTAFAILQAQPGLGRAEAMRQAMVAILEDPASSSAELHPRYWAPFTLAGEGGGR